MAAPFPTGDSPNSWRVADWAELRALAAAPFKRGDLKVGIANEDVKNPDLLEEQVWEELARRAALPEWPMQFDGNVLVPRARMRNRSLYRYFLLLGLGEAIDNTDRRRFEELIVLLLAPLVGGPLLRVGAPAHPVGTASFSERIDAYFAAASIADDERGQQLPATDQDLGLDVVGWFSFNDGRGGDLHVWAQCATGHDWEQKLTDLSWNVWQSHADLGVQPVRVFATPLALTISTLKWKRHSKDAGLILDRFRLMQLAEVSGFPRKESNLLARRFDELVDA